MSTIHNYLSVKCPRCGVMPGKACFADPLKPTWGGPHAERREDALEKEVDQARAYAVYLYRMVHSGESDIIMDQALAACEWLNEGAEDLYMGEPL